MDGPTVQGAMAVRTADGPAAGHDWDELRVRRDPGGGFSGTTGEIRDVLWSEQILPWPAGQTYRVGFSGSPSGCAVFDATFLEATQRRAQFGPLGPRRGSGRPGG